MMGGKTGCRTANFVLGLEKAAKRVKVNLFWKKS